MKRKWKIIITIAVLLIAAIGVYASTVYGKRGVVSVQTGKVVRGDLTSLVTASGEIKPKNYINIGANATPGKITSQATACRAEEAVAEARKIAFCPKTDPV